MESILKSGTISYEYIPRREPEQIREEDLIRDALARLEGKEQRIRDAYESGIDSLEEYSRNKARLKAEREDLERQAASLAESAPAPPSDSLMLSAIRDVYSLLSDPEVSYEKKGAAARRVIRTIIYSREENSFRFVYYLSE